jgi:uncharacterized protein (TIGR02266 family)
MAKDPGKNAAGETPTAAPAERRTASRAAVILPVRMRYDSVLDFVETQSMNISRTGMFIATDAPAPVGHRIDFEFSLSDGYTLLRGTAEVVLIAKSGLTNGMGLRFVDLDEANRRLIDRIVAVNDQEGRNSTLNFDFARPPTAVSMPVVTAVGTPAPPAASLPSPGAEPEAAPPAADKPAPAPVSFEGRNLRVALGPPTVHLFTQNPLLNARTGGLFVPAEEDVPLGTMFQVEIVDSAGGTLLTAKGKVVAKQELRVGIRLVDADKDAMARLRAEVGKLAPSK